MAAPSRTQQTAGSTPPGEKTAQPAVTPPGETAAQPAAGGPAADDRRGRDHSVRAALQPLGEHERPVPLLVAVGVAVALACAVLIGALTIHDLSRHGGSLPGGVFLAAVLLALAHGMHRRRYWAVLSFQALLAFQIIVTSLALVVAETWLAAGVCAASILLSGWLFWKLIRVLGRLQATERADAEPEGGTTTAAPRNEAPQMPSPAVDESVRTTGEGVRTTDQALR